MLNSYVGITKIISRIQKNHNGGGGRRICGNSPEILQKRRYQSESYLYGFLECVIIKPTVFSTGYEI